VEEPIRNRGERTTTLVVGGIMGAGLIWVTFLVAPWMIGLALSAILLYEGYTLINPYPRDTISEIIWWLSERPMVPMLGGIVLGYMLCAGYFGPPDKATLCGTAFFLAGHFWFQRHAGHGPRA
jgi:hypothetical protein